jgi:hypothetical protein
VAEDINGFVCANKAKPIKRRLQKEMNRRISTYFDKRTNINNNRQTAKKVINFCDIFFSKRIINSTDYI